MSKQRPSGPLGDWGGKGGPASRRSFLRAGGTVSAIALAGCTGVPGGGSGGDGSSEGSLTVFHAGSLEPPFSRAESAFEETHGADVSREARGSVASTKKITEQGRAADVLGVSDYRLIRDRLVPASTDWYAIFQTNAMTIHYTADSPGADAITVDNWWEILSGEEVTIGHADPAVDPGGYRSVMTMQLGKEPFEGDALYDQSTFEALRTNTVVSTGTEINLVGQLQSGKLDYAINYRSVGETADVRVLELQPEVDLSRATETYASHYARATVETDSGTFTGAPIAYGITVPGVARAPDLGTRWVAFLLGEVGRSIERQTGFVPVEPAVVPRSGRAAVPDPVMDRAVAKDSLGPLDL